YGIQDEGFDFVVKIDGNIDNVIGFPKETFYKMLKMIEENNYDK
ncbi:MAG: Maf family protein, partial [Lachnospiraceae bacterium]|nr:Maf family protein [Lachnospiraceae bacterium]